jgi:CRP-like cAMP-binding protein
MFDAHYTIYMYPEILAHIKRYVQLQPHEEQLVCDMLELKKYKKKEFLLEPGKLCPGNYFIVKGCIRQYFVNKKLNEQIIAFGLESWWIAIRTACSTSSHLPVTFKQLKLAKYFY